MDTSACTAGPGEGTRAINKDNQFGWGTAWRLHYLWQFLWARLRRALFQRVFIWLCVLLLSFIIPPAPTPLTTQPCECVNLWRHACMTCTTVCWNACGDPARGGVVWARTKKKPKKKRELRPWQQQLIALCVCMQIKSEKVGVCAVRHVCGSDSRSHRHALTQLSWRHWGSPCALKWEKVGRTFIAVAWHCGLYAACRRVAVEACACMCACI